jgi:type II secretory pathway predicted ATPase ExeA
MGGNRHDQDKEGATVMYPPQWGLRDTPFRSRLDLGSFYPSPTHDEAIARLHFLVESGRCLGLLLGESGSGKTLLLEVFAEELRRAGRAVAKASLQGTTTTELLWELATALGCNPDRGAAMGELWRTVCDRLAEHGYEKRETAILLDDADRADRHVLEHVVRLAHLGTQPRSRLTVVLASRPPGLGSLGRDLVEMAELRIELEPWSRSETEQYVNASLARAGGTSAVFASDAVARLQQLAEGIPRRVSQLADLAMVAAAGRGLRQIDAEVVQSVCEELSPIEAC